MATDLKLNDNYDSDIVGGDLVLVTGAEEVAQSVGIRLLTILGEWFFNYTVGVPWDDSMFTIATSYEQKQKILKDTILSTPKVKRLTSFTFGVDPENNTAIVNYSADTIYGPITSQIGV